MFDVFCAGIKCVSAISSLMAHGAAESLGNALANYYTEIRVNERGNGEEKVGVTTGRGKY